MPSEAPTAPVSSAQDHHDAPDEVFLAPRVVDERAFFAFSDRLRELVGRADRTHESLDGATIQSAELLSSLEAASLAHKKRAEDARALMAEVEKRVEELGKVRAVIARDAELISGFEKQAVAQRSALAEAATAAAARVAEAQGTLKECLDDAESRAGSLHATVEEHIQPQLDRVVEIERALAEFKEQTAQARRTQEEIRALAARGAAEAEKTRATAAELAGLRDQTESLLAAMRGTILECAEARDSADARFERLKSLSQSAGTMLTTVEARLKKAQEQAEKITPAELSLEPIVTEVSQGVFEAVTPRVMEAVSEQVSAQALDLAREHAARSDPAISARLGALEERLGGIESKLAEALGKIHSSAPAVREGTSADHRLDEIQNAIEMLSGIALTLTATPPAVPQRIEPAAEAETPPRPADSDRAGDDEPPARARRVVAPPLGATATPGTPFITAWSWTEG